MKVCYISSFFTIGGSRPENFLLDRLSKKHRIMIVTSNKLCGCGSTKLKVLRLNSFIFRDKIVSPALPAKLMDLDVDLFHLRSIGSFHAWVGSFIGKFRNIPTLLTMDWNLHDIVRYRPAIIYDFIIKYLAIKTTNLLTVYTNYQKEKLIENGAEAEKIEVVPNGVEYDRYSKIKKSKKGKAKLGLDPNNKIILMVSRISPEKNIELLITSFSRLKKEHDDIKLLLVGPKSTLRLKPTEDYYEKLESLTRRLKIEEDVIFYGPIDYSEIEKAYAAADIFAFSSPAEGFGNVLLQAVASGLPIVSTPVGIGPELIENGNCGVLAKDARSFTEGLDLLLSEKSLREKMGRNGRKIAKDYSWKKIASRYEKIYQRCVSQT